MRPFCVVPPGFEPRLTEPKSVVLPLHHGTNYPERECKDNKHFNYFKNPQNIFLNNWKQTGRMIIYIKLPIPGSQQEDAFL